MSLLLVCSPGWGEANSPLWTEDLKFQIFYLEGEKSLQNRQFIIASQHSLTYNNEGIEPIEGVTGYLRITLMRRFDFLDVYLEPLISIDEEEKGTLHKGYLRFKTSSLNIDIGKESLWWGRGIHGGLFLTKNAEPLQQVRLFTPNRYTLPGVFRYLGPVSIDLFVSRLEEDRVIPSPYFQGTRFEFMPIPTLEIGLVRTIITGGTGSPGISPARFFDIFFGENNTDTTAPDSVAANSIAGIDFKLVLPKASLYGELGGEDEAGGLPSRTAHLVGLYFPKGLLALGSRIEYADISNPVWYTHHIYQSGYTYKGRILGHHVGGGGRDFYIEQGIVKTDHALGKIAFDYEERGIQTEAAIERHYQARTDWVWNGVGGLIPWNIQVDLAYERIHNAGYSLGLQDENSIFQFTLFRKI